MSRTTLDAATEILCAALKNENQGSTPAAVLANDKEGSYAKGISAAFTIIYNTIDETQSSED